ncbi:MAG TPA: ABC transporter substrate-binding protein [Solirubrobacterales bacterium]|nr:ABC transporter substrate-binding protein [Solirubrobacterales bacterium]
MNKDRHKKVRVASMRTSSSGIHASSSSRPSRRRARWAGLLSALLVLGLVLSACGGGGATGAGGGTDPAEGSAGTPVKGGVLKFARSLDVDVGLNPIDAPSNGSIFVIQQIFDQLVEAEADSEVHPGLATKWESSQDGLHWTFHLRDAKFSNGEPVTAEDVKFSIERFADPKLNVNYSTLGESIKDVEVVDPHTVTINLSHVDASFLDNVAMFAAAIVPKKVVEEVGDKAFSEHPVGSGPFELKEYVRGQKTTLVPNPNYWRKGEPYLNEVVFEYVPDANTRVLKVRSGEAQVADAIPYNQVAALEGTEGLEVQSADTLSWTSVFLNLKKPPLEDEKIRQALNYATPKEQILESVLYGHAEISNSNTPKLKYWDESIPPYPYDIAKAKELMAESSSPDGFNLELTIPAGEPAVQQTIEILKQEWAKIGVTVNIVPKEFGAMFGAWLEGKGGMAATFPPLALSSDTLSDDEIVAITLDPSAGLNALGTSYDNPKVNRLIREAKGTLDEEKRAQDFAEIQQIALDEAPAVPLFFTQSLTAVGSEVKNFQTFPIGWWPLREVWLEG